MKTIIKSIIAISVAATALAACGNSSNSGNSSKAKQEEYSYKVYELNCPVKSIDERTYEASSKFGEVIKGEPTYGNILAEFDNAGNVIRITEYNSTGDVDNVRMYKYDEQNNNIEEMSYSREGELIGLEKREYNDEGKLIKWTRYNEHGDVWHLQVYEYEGGYPMKETNYTYVREYREKTVASEEWVEEAVSECEDDAFIVYDEVAPAPELVPKKEIVDEIVFKREGERVLECHSYRNGELVSLTKFSKYDAKGVSEGVAYDKDGVKLGEIYAEHDEYGLVQYRLNSFIDNIEIERRVERNNHGHVVYEYSYNSEDGKKETYYEYEYDSKGNWTKKIKLEGVMKKPVEIIEREIKY